MPWKETDEVDQRKEFVRRVQRQEQPLAALCREYGVSRKTGYKWLARYDADGTRGLHNRSRRPARNSRQRGEDEVCRLVRLKQKHLGWGPKKIRELYARSKPGAAVPALSTVKRILAKAGLVQRQRRRRRTGPPVFEEHREVQGPNDLWTVDFKGRWYSTEGARVEPLTVRDAYSRYVLCAEILPDGRSETVRTCFDGLFKRYGLPRAIRSDNGAPFACRQAPLGLSRLAVWWTALGIRLERSAPGHPEQNGGHERMHRDLAQEVEAGWEGALPAARAAVADWRREFNEDRPHEALGQRVPAEVYRRSARRYRGGPVEVEYPPGYHRRRVSDTGHLRVAGTRLRLTKALTGWTVGLQAAGAGVYRVWLGTLQLGEIDLKTETFDEANGSTPDGVGMGLSLQGQSGEGKKEEARQKKDRPGGRPTVLAPSRRSGCSPAEPYPPDGRLRK